jgi:hypothetical protein
MILHKVDNKVKSNLEYTVSICAFVILHRVMMFVYCTDTTVVEHVLLTKLISDKHGHDSSGTCNVNKANQ